MSEHSQKPSFSSVFTNSFPQILNQLGASLLVTTYQAGRLIIVRADGPQLNTHFVSMQKPMGLTGGRAGFFVGTKNEILEYRNVPVAATKLPRANPYDGCFVPRRRHTTGDIDIHEMVCDKNDQLWFANTRFSCLCTLDVNYSFVPRWRPPFISSYAPQDRCHLNGLSLRDGVPTYVTALGATDNSRGWRDNKKDGGILMDITRNEIIAEKLSMPHSPRWYQEQLWVLESGRGSLSQVNVETGQLNSVVELPGFTRGVDFIGDIAFIGLSQIRESATFSNLPLLERDEERACGVWVVHITTGKVLGFLKFEGVVQEVFSVQIIPNTRFPEILEEGSELVNSTYVLPEEALAEVDLSTGRPS